MNNVIKKRLKTIAIYVEKANNVPTYKTIKTLTKSCEFNGMVQELFFEFDCYYWIFRSFPKLFPSEWEFDPKSGEPKYKNVPPETDLVDSVCEFLDIGSFWGFYNLFAVCDKEWSLPTDIKIHHYMWGIEMRELTTIEGVMPFPVFLS